MNKHWSRNRIVIIVALMLSALAIYSISYFYIISPLKVDVTNKKIEVKMFESQIEKNESNKSGDIIDTELASIALKIPEKKSPDNMLVNVKKIADTTKVTITTIQSIASEESEESSIKNNRYTLEATTKKLSDMNHFLEKILKSDRLIIIDTLNVRQLEEEVSVSMLFSTFYTSD